MISSFFLLLLAGIITYLMAVDVFAFWALWFIGLGTLIGSFLPKANRISPKIVLYICPAIIFSGIFIRSLPVHNLNLNTIHGITIEDRNNTITHEINDPVILKKFQNFAIKGNYKTVIKSTYSYKIFVQYGRAFRTYFIYGDSIGEKPGGLSAHTIFVPSKKGLENWIESLVSQKK